jgi:hypothetical protein
MRNTLVVLAAVLLSCSLNAVAQTEVLYVATPQTNQPWLLSTYNVDPSTAVATPVGSPVNVESSNIIPLTVGSLHVLYVWTHTDVWVYPTDANGVPESTPSQHLAFGLSIPLTSFVVDPKGKFAYAAVTWVDVNQQHRAAIYLYTVDSANGTLADTHKLASTYGPDPYVGLSGFSFGASGARLFASFVDSAPFTCNYGYDEYPVNLKTGALGSLADMVQVDTECGEIDNVAISDQLTGYSRDCCGTGSGIIRLRLISTGQQINCDHTMLQFCGDNGPIYFDPNSQNLFFNDNVLNFLFVSRINFTSSQLIPTAQLPATYSLALKFSPDDQLFYTSQPTGVNIYAFQANTGKVAATTALAEASQVAIVATTLP